MTPAILVTTFPGRHVEQTIVPKLRAFGVDVRRTVSPSFNGSLDGASALIVIAQGTSEADRMALRKRAHAAHVAMVVLPPQQAQWPGILAAAKLPQAETPTPPKKPSPAPVVPAPPPTSDVTDERLVCGPKPITFGAWLREKRGTVSAVEMGKLLGVSDSLIVGWEREQMAIAPDHLALVKQLHGEPPAHVGPPKQTVRVRHVPRPVAVVPPSPPLPAPVEVVPAPNGHVVVAPVSSLSGLRRAARALGMPQDVLVTVSDTKTVVSIGSETWEGTGPEDAVAAARRDLDGRIAERLRALEEARAALGGGL